MNKPKRIKRGDKIGVVLPSSFIHDRHQDAFQRGLTALSKLGLQPVFAKKSRIFFASSEASIERARIINNFFQDKEIAGIFCALGGKTANAVLPFLNYDLIAENQKFFTGFSDNTTLLITISQYANLITFHFPDIIGGLGSDEFNIAEDLENYIQKDKILVNKRIEPIRIGRVNGKLIGGNISAIQRLLGTPYLRDITFENKILFLESYKSSRAEVEAIFEQFNQSKYFEKIRGLIIGAFYIADQESGYSISDLAKYFFKKIPIIHMKDLGHRVKNIMMPIGAEIKLISGKSSSIEISNFFKNSKLDTDISN